MLYINMIANALKINADKATKVFDMMYVPGGFSNASEAQIIEEAKITLDILSAHDRVEG